MTKQYVHRQGMGLVEAKPVAEFSPGEKMMWNCGIRTTYVKIVKETLKTITIESLSSNGKIYQRRANKTTLWAIG